MDEAVFNFFFGFAHQSVFTDWVITLVAEYLAYVAIVIAIFIISLASSWRIRMKMFLFTSLTVLISRWIIAEPIRDFVFRPRPPLRLGIISLFHESAPAFPSGHASVFFALAFTMFFFNKKWGYWFLIFAIVNSFARVAAGVHWPSDILGGVAVGAIAFFVVKALIGQTERQSAGHIATPAEVSEVK